MGPIERELVMRYDAIEHRLKIPPPRFHRIEASSREIELEAQVCSLKAQLNEALEKIDRISGFYTYSQSINRIIDLVCKGELVPPQDVLSERRAKDVSMARHIIFYLACKTTQFSTPKIGKYMGDRDHTTILHGRRKIMNLAAKDPILTAKLQQYEVALGSPI